METLLYALYGRVTRALILGLVPPLRILWAAWRIGRSSAIDRLSRLLTARRPAGWALNYRQIGGISRIAIFFHVGANSLTTFGT